MVSLGCVADNAGINLKFTEQYDLISFASTEQAKRREETLARQFRRLFVRNPNTMTISDSELFECRLSVLLVAHTL